MCDWYSFEGKSPFAYTGNIDFSWFLGQYTDIDTFYGGILSDTDFMEDIFLMGRYLKNIEKVEYINSVLIEGNDATGYKKVVSFQGKKMKVGYSQYAFEIIYVRQGNQYVRGYRAFFKNLCLIEAMDYIPLDKADGFGSVKVELKNKRRGVKSIGVVNNQMKSVLFLVDKTFDTLEEMEKDIGYPSEVDFSELIGQLVMSGGTGK